jgi:asparagine synthase (glutamine-hydrolysing)
VINGTASPDQLNLQLDRMLPGIASRGPDGCGRLVEPGVGLLHTRLAIIDLVTGDQPIWNERRTVACVFNGEIYNYRALAADLASRGHHLATRSDTEVLVHLYEDHGPDLVAHIHGMYAFAIFDRENNRVLLARDRLGMKPLFITESGGRMAFASSIESLVSVGASRDPDNIALAHYLRYYRVPEPRTAFKAIRTLPAGHVSIIRLDSGTKTARAFFDPGSCGGSELPTGDLVANARGAFQNSIRSHLIADVEVGAFLSGGIDSSLVVAEAQRLVSRPLRTFCVGFAGAGQDYDETRYAERVAAAIGTRHETIRVTSPPTDLIRFAIRATNQPFAVASFLPLLTMCRRASQDVKVVLTGDGGDEVGFGYPWYRWIKTARAVHSFLPTLRSDRLRPLERLMADRGLHSARRALKFARGLLLPSADAADAWRYELEGNEAVALLNEEHRPSTAPSSPNDARWPQLRDAAEALRRVDLRVSLCDEMLTKVDRAGMAFGLEGRVPLLDDEFVEAMMRIPAAVHMSDPRGKAVLRAWARELVPGIDADRPKHGFDVPIGQWLVGELYDDVRRLLLDPSKRGLTDKAAVAKVWRRVQAGVPGAAHTAYALLVAELWFESTAGTQTTALSA